MASIYPRIYGIEILVDSDFDLTYFTLPILGFNLIYVSMLIMIFTLYLGGYARVRNEQSVIKRTVLDCLKQTYQKIEIIVICHNCSDRTFDEAKVNDPRVKVFNLQTKEAGKGIALNFGVEKSSGNYIMILDSDGLLTRD